MFFYVCLVLCCYIFILIDLLIDVELPQVLACDFIHDIFNVSRRIVKRLSGFLLQNDLRCILNGSRNLMQQRHYMFDVGQSWSASA